MKQQDENTNIVNKKRHSLSTIIFLSIIGSIFVALGIGVLYKIVSSIFKFPNNPPGWIIIIPILLFVILPIAFGTFALVLAGKQVYFWLNETKTSKSGITTTAKIVDYKVVCRHDNINSKYYALTLEYKIDGETKKFTTDYLYDINEYNHLKSLENVKIKVDKNFVVIDEKFTKDIYKYDPKYGIELDFYRQKHVAITLKVWRWTSIPAVIFLFVSIVLTCVFNNGLYLIIGVCLLVGVNLPVAITMAIFLIRWIWGNDKKKFEQKKYNGKSKYNWKKQNKNSQND